MFTWLRRKTPPVAEEKRRVLDALADYPPYSPPKWNAEVQSIGDAANEYRAYFFDNRKHRVEALRRFLAKFDVELNRDDDGVKAVSAWCPVYADLLVEGLGHHESEAVWCAYHWLQTPWMGPLIGLNPAFDLGVYMGECLLHRNPRLKWLPVRNPDPDRGASHPIFGRRCGRPFDPIKWIYTECGNIHSARMAKEKPSLTRLYGRIKARDN